VSAGRVILAATPLGNVGDASSRLSQALASVDIVAAEDCRSGGWLGPADLDR
jgi:16S rRNA (cytidine1402-2'-O)-methyltransferase